MGKVKLIILSLLAFLVAPVAAIAITTCPESSPTADCTIAGGLISIYPPDNDGSVFQYNTFEITQGAILRVVIGDEIDGSGGNITIIANRILIAGELYARGGEGNLSFTFDGGDGGSITLIARNLLSIGRTGSVKASGYRGRANLSRCIAGNGGNGGNIALKTVSGARVNIAGELNVTGGIGANLSYSCNVTGTNGNPGNVTIGTFTPSVVQLGLNVDSTLRVLRSGSELQLIANGTNEFGDAITTAVTWSSNDTSVVQLNNVNGTHATALGLRKGYARITASQGGLQRVVNVKVKEGDFTNITIERPTDTTLEYSELSIFYLTGRDFGGNEVPIPVTEHENVEIELTNNSEAEGLLASCLGGLISCTPPGPRYAVVFRAGEKPGRTIVRITYNNISTDVTYTIEMPESAVASVEISPSNPIITSGSSQQFRAIGIDDDGDEAYFDAEWNLIEITGTGEINNNGLLTTGEPGVLMVNATVNNISASTSVLVQVGREHHVNVSGPSTATVGQPVQLSATLRDARENELSEYNNEAPEYIWETTSGTMYPNGTLVVTIAGTVTVTAKLRQNQAISGTKQITINAGTAQGLVVVDSGASLEVGSTYILEAVLIDKYGNEVATTEASWLITNATGRADLRGRLITPTRIGYVTVQATSLINSSLTATGVFTIVHAGVARIELEPSNAYIRPQQSITFTARAFDAFGNEFTLLLNPVWGVSNTTVATINSNGVLTALKPGVTTVTVRVSGDDESDSVTVNVLQPLGEQNTVAVQLTGTLPDVTVQQLAPRRTARIEEAGSAGGSLSGLFTAGGNTEMLLIAALAILLVGLVAYYTSARR